MVGNDNNPTSQELMNFALFADCDPLSFEEVAQDDCWLKVMDEKIYAIEKNNTREFINLPNSKKPISIKWLYKNQLQKKWWSWSLQGKIGGKML